MKQLLLALALFACAASPALAYDPETRLPPDTTGPGTGGPEAQTSPDAIAAEQGLHRVTDVYAGERVTRSGDATVYSTDTEHKPTDTYAKALDVVRTGERSTYDGASFNGRGTNSNGERLAGTYYQDYVWNGQDFVAVNVVFFQDDSEAARKKQAEPGAPADGVERKVPDVGPVDRTPPDLEPIDRITPPGNPGEGPDRDHPDELPLDVVVGVDPSGGPAVLRSLEVARGARYALAVNARAAQPIVLEAWQLRGGVNEAANPSGWHAPADRLAAGWSRLAAPGAAWSLALRVRVHRVGGAPFVADGVVQILVRAPAIVE